MPKIRTRGGALNSRVVVATASRVGTACTRRYIIDLFVYLYFQVAVELKRHRMPPPNLHSYSLQSCLHFRHSKQSYYHAQPSVPVSVTIAFVLLINRFSATDYFIQVGTLRHTAQGTALQQTARFIVFKLVARRTTSNDKLADKLLNCASRPYIYPVLL